MPFTIPKATVEIEPGTYKATLLGSEIVPEGNFKTPQNPTGEYRTWDWLIDKAGEGVPFTDYTSVNNGPKSTAYSRLTALLGRAPQAGEEIEDPVGKTAMLQIGKKENGYPKIEAVIAYVEPQQTLPGIPR